MHDGYFKNLEDVVHLYKRFDGLRLLVNPVRRTSEQRQNRS